MAMIESAMAPRPIVLIVEDEVLLRLTLAEYLRECGYKVIEAASFDEAVAILAKPDIDVKIVMSGLGSQSRGFELSKWLRDNRPGVPAILAGTIAKAANAAAELCEEGPTLRKPYEPKAVEAEVRRLLRSGALRKDCSANAAGSGPDRSA